MSVHDLDPRILDLANTDPVVRTVLTLAEHDEGMPDREILTLLVVHLAEAKADAQRVARECLERSTAPIVIGKPR